MNWIDAHLPILPVLLPSATAILLLLIGGAALVVARSRRNAGLAASLGVLLLVGLLGVAGSLIVRQEMGVGELVSLFLYGLVLVSPVSQLDPGVHIPADWPARALLWMCGTGADDWLGTEISLRDEAIRRAAGLI